MIVPDHHLLYEGSEKSEAENCRHLELESWKLGAALKPAQHSLILQNLQYHPERQLCSYHLLWVCWTTISATGSLLPRGRVARELESLGELVWMKAREQRVKAGNSVPPHPQTVTYPRDVRPQNLCTFQPHQSTNSLKFSL